jgi:hypothetical protein
MNDENQENDRPVILTIPASLTLPGFGFLVALNRDWCFSSQERNANRHRASRRDSSVVPGEQPTLTKNLSNSSERNGTLVDGV